MGCEQRQSLGRCAVGLQPCAMAMMLVAMPRIRAYASSSVWLLRKGWGPRKEEMVPLSGKDECLSCFLTALATARKFRTEYLRMASSYARTGRAVGGKVLAW